MGAQVEDTAPPCSGGAASLGQRVKSMSPQNQGSSEQKQSQSWLFGYCSQRKVRKIKWLLMIEQGTGVAGSNAKGVDPQEPGEAASLLPGHTSSLGEVGIRVLGASIALFQ